MSATIIKRIKTLLKERNAILLAHNYQPPDLQDVADFTGDSLELSLLAAQTHADVIVFCGVLFMAETAAILSPEKTVILPRDDAGCPLADMITPEALAAKRRELKEIPVVAYVNSPASVKALPTVCCTSANALTVVDCLEDDEILMVPDRNLAQYTASRTDKTVHYSHATVFIVGTEEGLLYPLQQQNPHETFYKASDSMVCKDMKRIGLIDVLQALENMRPEIKVPREVREPALQAVQKMLRQFERSR